MHSGNYKILKNDKLGRYMVANKNIKPGEIILTEAPTIVGSQLDGPLMCFNCCKNVRSGYIFCRFCNSAVICNPKCSGKFHTKEECVAFKEVNVSGSFLVKNYTVVFPLRCLLLRNYKPEIWTAMLELESHLELRRDTPIWRRNELIVEEIIGLMNLLSEEDKKNEIIQNVCGILDVNTFEVRPPQCNLQDISNPVKQCLRGLYLNAALMAHDCIGNTFLSVDDELMLSVKASVNIPEGAPIFFNYANVLHGSMERRQHLREGKYFDCFCGRCNDNTELGTEMSSLKCHKCKYGLIRIKQPDNLRSDWECSNCKQTFNRFLVNSTVEEGRRRIEEVDRSSIFDMEDLREKLLSTFHSNHYIMLELQQNMIEMYMRLPQNKKNLTRKITLCQGLLEIFSKIEPGISRLRAITLYQLQSSLIDLAHKEYQDRGINMENLITKLSTAESKLKEAISYLLYEPSKSPEGKIAEMALSELKMLRLSIANIQKDFLSNGKHYKNKHVNVAKECGENGNDIIESNRKTLQNDNTGTLEVSSGKHKKRGQKNKRH